MQREQCAIEEEHSIRRTRGVPCPAQDDSQRDRRNHRTAEHDGDRRERDPFAEQRREAEHRDRNVQCDKSGDGAHAKAGF